MYKKALIETLFRYLSQSKQLTFYDDARHGDDRYVVLAEGESHTSAVVEQKRAAAVAEVQSYPEAVDQNALVEVGQNDAAAEGQSALVVAVRNALVVGT